MAAHTFTYKSTSTNIFSYLHTKQKQNIWKKKGQNFIMACNIIYIFCLYLEFANSDYVNPDHIPPILDEFQIYHPIVQNELLDANYFTAIVKHLSFKGYRLGFNQNKTTLSYQSFLIFTNLRNFKWNLPTYSPILVISRIQNDIDLKQVDVSIGSEVLFVDWFSLKVFEAYNVNKVHVTRYLGQFQVINESKNDISFFASKNYTYSMEKRRGNFYGQPIRIALSNRGLRISDPEDFPNQVTYFPNNNTYDVTNLVSASENRFEPLMILKWMENKFNFTAKYFIRKDMKLGSPRVLSNGSIVLGDGVFQDIVQGLVDIVCMNLVMLPERANYGKFLPAISTLRYAIYIPNVDSVEYLDWNVFLGPFSTEMWMALLLKCISFSIFAYIIEWLHDYNLVN